MHECPQWRAALQHLKWGLSGGFGPVVSQLSLVHKTSSGTDRKKSGYIAFELSPPTTPRQSGEKECVPMFEQTFNKRFREA
jgi:hypothetical protein